MATDNSTGPDRTDRTTNGIASTAARLVGDLLVVTCWVVFLTLLFLEAAWPRWAFYPLLVLGVGIYVTVTAAWSRSRT